MTSLIPATKKEKRKRKKSQSTCLETFALKNNSRKVFHRLHRFPFSLNIVETHQHNFILMKIIHKNIDWNTFKNKNKQ